MIKLAASLIAGAVLLCAQPALPQDRLAQLLLSGPWCRISFNQRTGYGNRVRIVFNQNGTYTQSGRATGYSDGSGGRWASQHDSQAAGRWVVRNEVLYISEGNGPLEQVDLRVKFNSNGHPIIITEAGEHVRCD